MSCTRDNNLVLKTFLKDWNLHTSKTGGIFLCLKEEKNNKPQSKKLHKFCFLKQKNQKTPYRQNK